MSVVDDSASPASFGVDGFTVGEVLGCRARELPDELMLTVAGTDITFAQMQRYSAAAGEVLVDLGVRRGDTVALFTANSPEWVYFWLGAARIGAVTAAINAASKGEFLTHALRLSCAKVVVTDRDRHPRVREVVADTAVESTVVLDGRLSERLERRIAALDASDGGRPEDIGTLFFTSGTTGPSKAVALTWHYMFSAAATAARAWELGRGEALLSSMPLFHLSAAPLVLAPLLVGGSTRLTASFRPGETWDEARACGAVGFVGAGAMVSMLWNQPPDPRDAQLPLRFISAAPLSAELQRGIRQRYGCRIVTMYGLTEAFPIAVKPVSGDVPPGSSGRVNPVFEVKILDPDGHPLPAGQTGEIVCRAGRPHVMSEGYVQPDVGRQGWHVEPHPEWFHTGDLGALDEDGALTYIDRVKDSIRRRGENISSVEVETVVRTHSAVLEAAAVGVPSDVGEEDVLVLVTVRPGATVDYSGLLDFCSGQMPYFCVPRYLEIVDEMPTTALGRLRKDVLRARGLGAGAWDREAHGYKLSR